MATLPDDQGGAPPNEDEQRPDDAPPNPETNDTDEGDPDDPVAALALEMGWTPKDKFNGPEDQWKDAASFIRSGREIQRNYARELKDIRGQLDVVARTSAQIVADQVEEKKRELADRYNELVDDGKAAEAFKVARQIDELDRRPIQAPTPPSSEGQEFAERHAAWFNKDGAATARAIQVCDDLAAKGVSKSDQLKAAERVVRAEYPEYFTGQANGQRAAPHVSAPGSRSAAPSNRQKGFADMPKAAQDIATDMLNRGVIKTKDDYVNRYWQNQKGAQ